MLLNGIDVPGINPQTGVTADSSIINLSNGGYTTYYRAFPITVISVPFNTLGLTGASVPAPRPSILSFIYSFIYAGSDNVLNYIPVITSGGSLTISSSYAQVGTTYTVTVELVNFTDNGTTTNGISFNSTKVVNTFYRNIPVTIQQFGSIPFSRQGSVFAGLLQLTILPTAIPVILPNTSFSSLFLNCTNFNSDISNWNTSAVTNMSSMFQGATAFNQPIGTWNTSAVTDMGAMFNRATAFDQPIGTWNTAAVTIMGSMFEAASAFNQPIGTWNTGAVTNMNSMFQGATAFNQNISYSGSGSIWNTALVTNMIYMFYNATAFNNGNVPLNWLTPNVTLPVQDFRTGSALTNTNNVNSSNQQIGV